ncbi:MAG: GNAT family N-acetyltransferase, partial [Treponema sp.]|nr:GNAT family N-acetyltransferase [Treponema sp.]
MTVYETLDNGLRIVEYEDALAQAVADMWNRSREAWGDDGSVATAAQVAGEHATAAFFNVYIALDGDEAVGYCSLARYHADANTLYVATLNVRPDWHGKKVGKALVLLCSRRAVELGYPRIDLHTWSGNVAAVPLYKKCGYLWEDRPDRTHLVNFMPTILTTELFAPFFAKADWYADSTRALEITPDGAKENGFEVFGYSWEKGDERLAVGFERSGRRMWLIETNDYTIAFMAEDHCPPFGIACPCAFTVENRSGRDLRLKIQGRSDGNIRFDFSLDETVAAGSSRVFPGSFVADPLDEPIDKWKVHPCALADVEINGMPVEFGLGIKSRHPFTATLADEVAVKRVGMEIECHVAIASALSVDATVCVEFPDGRFLSFINARAEVFVKVKGKASFKARAKVLGIGYEALAVKFAATVAGGEEFHCENTIHVVNRDLVACFAARRDEGASLYCGPWELDYGAQHNSAKIRHAFLDGAFSGWHDFSPPQLGKPYAQEFDVTQAEITTRAQGPQ